MSFATTSAIRRAMGGPFRPAMGGVSGGAPVTYEMDFDGTALTNVSSVREFVNSGTQVPLVNATLRTGQGLEPLAVIYANTGKFIDTTVAGSLLMTVEIGATHNGNVDVSGVNDGTNFFWLGNNSATQLSYAIGTTVGTLTHTLASGTMQPIAICWDGAGNYVISAGDNNASTTVVEATFVLTQPFYVGCYQFGGVLVMSRSQHLPCMDFYYLEGVQLSVSDKSAHYQNPENTLYRVGTGAGSLRSDIASIDSTIRTALEAGTGFWYPLSETVLAESGGTHYAVNQAQYETFTVGTATVITGMTTTTPRLNAAAIEYGNQAASYVFSADGMLGVHSTIAWQTNTGADLTAQALAENNLSVVVTGAAPITAIDVYKV